MVRQSMIDFLAFSDELQKIALGVPMAAVGALGGAALGGAVGGVTAGQGGTGRGIARGALLGGAAGGGLGALKGVRAAKALRGAGMPGSMKNLGAHLNKPTTEAGRKALIERATDIASKGSSFKHEKLITPGAVLGAGAVGGLTASGGQQGGYR